MSREDVTETFRILGFGAKVDDDAMFGQVVEDGTRNSGAKLWQTQSRLNMHEDIFRNRVVGAWKKLTPK